jgi:hypothetical protein
VYLIELVIGCVVLVADPDNPGRAQEAISLIIEEGKVAVDKFVQAQVFQASFT